MTLKSRLIGLWLMHVHFLNEYNLFHVDWRMGILLIYLLHSEFSLFEAAS